MTRLVVVTGHILPADSFSLQLKIYIKEKFLAW